MLLHEGPGYQPPGPGLGGNSEGCAGSNGGSLTWNFPAEKIVRMKVPWVPASYNKRPQTTDSRSPTELRSELSKKLGLQGNRQGKPKRPPVEWLSKTGPRMNDAFFKTWHTNYSAATGKDAAITSTEHDTDWWRSSLRTSDQFDITQSLAHPTRRTATLTAAPCPTLTPTPTPTPILTLTLT